jgi:hypothetical protein
MIRVVHPGSDFSHIPAPGSMGQKGTGSRIRNTVFLDLKSTTLHVTIPELPEEPHVNLHLRVKMLRMLQQKKRK